MKKVKLNEVFNIKEEDDWREGVSGEEAKETFEQKLKLLASKNGGKIPFTHLTRPENLGSIKKNGLVPYESSGGAEAAGEAVFMVAGHKDKDLDWTSWDDENSVAIWIDIPISEINSLVPDLNWFEMAARSDAEYGDEYIEILQDHPDLDNGAIMYTEKIPSSWFVKIFEHGFKKAR